MKIILVDDEGIVLRGLSTIIKRSAPQWEIVAQCGSGEEAIHVIKELCPDVVITDIRMYNISGIELAEKIRESNPDILFILLTGYAEFDYAQKAIKLNVFDYLLKPTRYNEIIDCLTRAERYLKERNDNQSFQNSLVKKINENKILLREKFFSDIMKGLLPVSVDISEKVKEYDIYFKRFTVFNISYKSLTKSFGTSTEDIFLLDFCIKNVFTEILGEARKTILLTESIDNFISVSETVDLGEGWQKYMYDLCVRASNTIMEKLGVKLYIGCSEVKYEIEELFDCYNQACYALDKAMNEDNPIIFFQDLKYEMPQNAFSKSISEAINYIDNNFQNDISLKEVAEAVYLNVWYLSDLFKKEVGVTFSEYIREKRIHKAKELLRDKSLKLYEVAYKVGIKEQGYFSTLFKKATGLSPTSYREQIK